MPEIYTLKNCDTCKKALKWLTEHNVTFRNHDVRTDGLDAATVEKIVNALGQEKALNRRSTTWRELPGSAKENLDNSKAVTLILEHPTLMKRPVFLFDDAIICGFDANSKAAIQART